MLRNLAVLAALLGAVAAHGDLNDAPPRAALITLSAADAAGDISITGASSAVAAGSTVLCITLDTGHYATAQASLSGAFSIPRLYAPAGTFVLIKIATAGAQFGQIDQGIIGLVGTILRVAEPPPRDGVPSFGGASLISGPAGSLVWRFEGSATQQSGGAIVVRGSVIIDSPAVDDAGPMTAMPRLTLERFTLADGSPTMAQATFASTIVTPTGFPIERTPRLFGFGGETKFALQRTAPGRAEAQIEVQYRPQRLPADGLYRPVLTFEFEGVPGETTPSRPVIFDLKAVDRASRKTGKNSVYGPLLAIGDPAPPRMRWMLLADQLSEGTRGVRAIEDRERFNFAPRVATQSDTFIVPPGGRYRLEPYAPTVSLGDRELPSPPLIAFRFPSGSLRAEVTRPDGSVTSIAAQPFVQSRSINRVTRGGSPLDLGGGYPHDPYQLSTMDPRFELPFDASGKYVIRLEGSIDDVWGNRWSASGTYEILVANQLVLDTAVLPGTPFETGNVLSADVQVIPPVPADVEVRVIVFADSTRRSEVVLRGRANRFGHCHIEGIRLDQQGEYRIDVIATHRDAGGELWAGARTWGSVVAPRDAALVAHGDRGIDDMPMPRPIWFRRTTPTGSGHINLPFLGGDVLWATDDDAAITHITWDDPGKLLAQLMQRFDGGTQARYAEGATPPRLFTSTGDDAHLDPGAIDFWSYAYRSVQRPLVRVRELVGEESGIAGYYWRFGSSYGGQRGVGANGDLQNDFKFQFGGVVVRGPAVGAPHYAAYGSLFVLDNGGSRVFPPFQGNGGGADGGPLFLLKGKPVDLFLHLTGLRPGSILHLGEVASITGYAAPTLPAKIEITITSPSGRTRTMRGQANAIGYVHDPSSAFVVDEEGVWTATVKILFDGRTSAGQVTAPFPTGDVLGSRQGAFFFYVVANDTPPLAINRNEGRVRPADGPIRFSVTAPAGLRDLELTTTTTMPGFLLEEQRGAALAYTYDAQKLALDFPNLDLHDDDGSAGVDTITISFLLSGTDDAGGRRHFARQLVIQGEELQLPPQDPRPKRRAARK